MKHILIFALVLLCFIFGAVSCELSDASGGKVNEEATVNPDIINEGLPSDTEKEETVAAEIGKEYSIDVWSLKVNSMTFTDKVADSEYFGFNADEGTKYLVIDVTIVNNDKSAKIFMPSFSFGTETKPQVIYKEEYEYSSTIMLGYSKDMHNSTVQPLASKTGEIIISVPDTVVNDKSNASLVFTYSNQKVIYNLP